MPSRIDTAGHTKAFDYLVARERQKDRKTERTKERKKERKKERER